MGKASQKNGLGKLVEVARLTPIEQMSGDSKKDTLLLKEMAGEAREFLLSFKWCRNIRRSWFGWGVGGVCAVFFFEIDRSSKKVDQWLWVIVGDLPPAYLVVDASPTPLAALANYVDLMQEWADAVKDKRPVNDCIPVNAPATREYADLLQRRLNFIRKEFLIAKPRAKRKDGSDGPAAR
ncbi:MAG TPA: hypothetical protein VHP99_14350 [Pyrinomonadaceae bacterium]|jgi:hypothetical protein|nr:hypothetical protein [Pyrinomonadaceae bacterium]